MAGSGGAQVDGVEALAATLHRAGEELANLEAAHAAAGELVVTVARPRTPRRTGRLAASVRYAAQRNTVTLGSELPYAAAVHARTPWLARTLAEQEAKVVELITTAVKNTFR